MPAKNTDTGNKRKSTTITDDILDALRSDAMINNAQKVITSAVNILEEEIAAGIIAAKKIERKVIDVDDIRSNPDDLMNRIRRDTHDAVDLLLDSVTALMRQLNLSATNTTTNNTTSNDTGTPPTETAKKAPVTAEPTIPIVKNETPAKPGQEVTLQLTLSNDHHEAPVIVAFRKAMLTAGANWTIRATAMQFKPAKITLAHQESKQMAIHIKIPKNAPPGNYSALLVDVNDDSNKVIISLNIA